SGLNLDGTKHVNVGSYPTDPWTFTDVTGNYNNANGTVSDTILQAFTKTRILSDTPDPSTVGQMVTVSFDVTPSNGGVPTGSVTVSDGAGANCVAVLAAAAGSCSLTPTVPGTRNFTATYAGDSNYVGSFGTASHSVVPAP